MYDEYRSMQWCTGVFLEDSVAKDVIDPYH